MRREQGDMVKAREWPPQQLDLSKWLLNCHLRVIRIKTERNTPTCQHRQHSHPTSPERFPSSATTVPAFTPAEGHPFTFTYTMVNDLCVNVLASVPQGDRLCLWALKWGVHTLRGSHCPLGVGHAFLLSPGGLPLLLPIPGTPLV